MSAPVMANESVSHGAETTPKPRPFGNRRVGHPEKRTGKPTPSLGVDVLEWYYRPHAFVKKKNGKRVRHPQALFLFGVAIHPLMDMTSPAHTDANGNPIPWCGDLGCSGNRKQVLQHSPNESIGHETVRDLNANPEVQRRENLIIRNWYESVTGQKLDCGCNN